MVHSFNEAAIRSYEKCGFVKEGAKREAHWSQARYYDINLM